MTALLSRLLLAMATVAGAPVVYLFAYLILENTWARRDVLALHAANIITGCLLVACWLSVWRAQVVWTPWRRALTALAVLWSIGLGTIVGLSMALWIRQDEVGVILGGTTWAVSWVASTAIIWRETPVERVARLRSLSGIVINCLRCGYNMTGLQQARCPECGTQYTLDQLFASVSERAGELGEQRTADTSCDQGGSV
ncbi:MAG: hypothetical protein V2A79_16625 [Planctomycetota bacterium]